MIKYFITSLMSLIITASLHSQSIPYNIEFQVNSYTEGSQEYPTIAARVNGGFVVCWQSYNQDGLEYGVFGQQFDCNGDKQR